MHRIARTEWSQKFDYWFRQVDSDDDDDNDDNDDDDDGDDYDNDNDDGDDDDDDDNDNDDDDDDDNDNDDDIIQDNVYVLRLKFIPTKSAFDDFETN